MQNEELSAEQIKIIFAKRARIFYLLNIIVIVVTIVVLAVARGSAHYPLVFGVTTFAFLLWIFNADRYCLCPACGQVPRGAQGLISKPKQCAKCGAVLG